MDPVEVKLWLNANKSAFPIEQMGLLSSVLEKMNETTYKAATSQKILSPFFALILAIFFPGVDQIYIGKVGMGIFQMIFLNIPTCGIYPFIRLFIVMRETRNANAIKLTSVL